MVPFREKSFGIICTLTASSPYTVYTCPAKTNAKITYLHVANLNGANTVSVGWNDGTNTYQILGNVPKAAGSFETFQDSKIVLSPGDTVEISIDSDGEVHVICTVEELFKPNYVEAT